MTTAHADVAPLVASLVAARDELRTALLDIRRRAAEPAAAAHSEPLRRHASALAQAATLVHTVLQQLGDLHDEGQWRDVLTTALRRPTPVHGVPALSPALASAPRPPTPVRGAAVLPSAAPAPDAAPRPPTPVQPLTVVRGGAADASVITGRPSAPAPSPAFLALRAAVGGVARRRR